MMPFIGKHTYYGSGLNVRGATKELLEDLNLECRIGSYCSIAESLTLFIGQNHDMEFISTYPFGLLGYKLLEKKTSIKGSIIIGNDVWIGSNVTIMSNVNIGNGAVIGCNSVVASNVSDYSVVVGNTARVIRKRFTDTQISKLLKISWWDWSDTKIKNNIKYLYSKDIDTFIDKFYNLS